MASPRRPMRSTPVPPHASSTRWSARPTATPGARSRKSPSPPRPRGGDPMTKTNPRSAPAAVQTTVRLTTAQAIVRYLAAQTSVRDCRRQRLIPAMLGIFGHGNVAGIGQALDEYQSALPFVQGRNEQSLVHIAAAYAKASRRTATLAVTASIGPGAANMITGAALATVNRLPVLLFPGDPYATRRQGPVLQQLEHPSGG